MADPIESKGDDDYGEVDLDEDEDGKKKPKSVEYDEDDPNLAYALSESDEGQEYLEDLARRIDQMFWDEWDASEGYRERFAKDWKLLECALNTRDDDESLRPHLPIMLKNITRLAFRAESELFGDWSRPVSWAPVGDTEEDMLKSEARTKHTNWQYREQILDFRRQMARAMMAFFFAGEAVTTSYRDTLRGFNRHEYLTPEEFVMPYMYKSVMPNLSDCPWYVQILQLYKHDLLARRDDWLDVEEVIEKVKPQWTDDPEQPLRESIADREGHEPGDSESGSAPYTLLQWEGWETELPGQDEPRWMQVIIDLKTKRVLKVAIHEEAPLDELDRYEREGAELEEYKTARLHHKTMVERARGDIELAGAVGAPVPPEAQSVMQMPPPDPPPWMPLPEDPDDDDEIEAVAPAPLRKKPIFMYARAVNIENLVGNHGIGHGRMQAHYNRIGNNSLHQYADAAGAANIPSYLHDKRAVIGEGKGRIKFAPGQTVPVEMPGGGSLKDAIMPFTSPAANPQLVDLARMIDEMAQESAQSPDVLSGESGKSGETFRGLASRVEQATKQLSVPTGRFSELVRQISKNNAVLNATFLDDEEVISVLDPASRKFERLKVGRALYETGAYDVSITSDLRFISKRERVAEADEALAMPKAWPPPLAAQPGITHYIWAASKKALEARGFFDLVPSLGPEPPRPTTPFGLPPPAPPGPPQGSPALPGGAGGSSVPATAGGSAPPPGSESAGGPPPGMGG